MTVEERLEKLERIIKILVEGLKETAKKANVYFLVKPMIEKLEKELNNESN